MAELSVNSISKAGIADVSAVLVAADAAGDSVASSSGIFINMTNNDASAHTLTVAKPAASATCGSLGELQVDDIVLTVAAGQTGYLSIPLGYSDGSNNFAWTYDDVTSVTVGVFSISP